MILYSEILCLQLCKKQRHSYCLLYWVWSKVFYGSELHFPFASERKHLEEREAFRSLFLNNNHLLQYEVIALSHFPSSSMQQGQELPWKCMVPHQNWIDSFQRVLFFPILPSMGQFARNLRENINSLKLLQYVYTYTMAKYRCWTKLGENIQFDDIIFKYTKTTFFFSI